MLIAGPHPYRRVIDPHNRRIDMETMGRFLVTLVAPVFVVVGLHCGIVMPDIDQRTTLLLHRSIITHSPLIPVIVVLLALRIGLGLYTFAMGVSIGFAVHHAFDLFPKGWTGAALILSLIHISEPTRPY